MALKFLNNGYFAGKVGIGVLSPNEKLEVAGNIKLNDNNQLLLGTSSDLQIFHNGADSFIDNYTGNLTIRNRQDDGNIVFTSDDGSGGLAEYFRIDGGEVETLFSKTTHHSDNIQARFGDSGDLRIYHDGSNSFIKDTGTGDLYVDAAINFFVRNQANGEVWIKGTDSGVSLRYQDSQKLITTNTGVTVTGNATVAGDVLVEDNLYLTDAGTVRGKIQLNSSDRDNLDIKATSLGSLMRFYTVDTLALTLDATQNAAFAGNVTVGNKLMITSSSDYIDVISDDLYIVAADKNILYSGNAETLRLDESQNATFAGAVAVNGTNVTVANASNPYIYLNDTNAGAGIFQQEGNTTRIGSDSNTQVVLVQNNATAVTIDTSKNVGIGTTSPTARLDILTNSATGNSNIDKHIRFRADNGEQRFNFKVGQSGNAANLGIYNEAEVQKVKIDTNGDSYFNGGNVGIGTTSPQRNLTIYESSGNAVLQLANNTSGVGASDGFLAYTDGTNVGLENKENGYLSLATNASEKMRVTSAGNVGIGTTSPGAKLHTKVGTSGGSPYDSSVGIFAEGATRSIIQMSSTSDAYLMFGDASTNNQAWFGYNHANDQLLLHTGSSITMNGNVGIGETSPDGKLHIHQTGSGTLTTIITEDDARKIFIGRDAINCKDLSNNAALLYLNQAGGNVTISNNLGIGTTSPGVPLDVTGTIRTTTSFVGNASVINQVTAATSSGSIKFKNNSGVDRAIITDAGNVGIGTTSPGTNLAMPDNYILGLGNSTDLRLYHDGSNSYINDIGTGGLIITSSQTTFQTSGANRMVIDSSGNVGIGTTSPAYKLTVSGGIEAGGKVTYTKQAGSLDTTGYAVAGITALPAGNGFSCGFTFTCFGFTNYQKIVYSCYNAGGTWYAKKLIDEGTDKLDVVASADGSTITFTYKTRSGTVSYTPKVTVEAIGTSINSTYA